jgi:hypothetical protein
MPTAALIDFDMNGWGAPGPPVVTTRPWLTINLTRSLRGTVACFIFWFALSFYK